jgi:hypothetical protein
MSIKADNDMAALLDDSPLFLCLLTLVLTLVFIIDVTNVGFVKPRTAIARSDHFNNPTRVWSYLRLFRTSIRISYVSTLVITVTYCRRLRLLLVDISAVHICATRLLSLDWSVSTVRMRAAELRIEFQRLYGCPLRSRSRGRPAPSL